MSRALFCLLIPLIACKDGGHINLDDSLPSGDDSEVTTDDSDTTDDSSTDDSNSDDSAVQDPDSDGDGSPQSADCDDNNSTIHPGAAELCDQADNDCDGTVDEDPVDGVTWYPDADGDGYGETAGISVSCELPSGASTQGSDCDEHDKAVNPAATEVCDDKDRDEDCDGLSDDADEALASSQSTWYLDLDGDGYGDPDSATQACDLPSGYTDDNTDCDDSDATLNTSCPGAWDGTYSGTMTMKVTVGSFGSDTCTGTGSATLSETASPALSGSLKCSFSGTLSGFGTQSATIDGEFSGASSIDGNIAVGTYISDTWVGVLSGSKQLDGSFSGTTTLYGYSVTYSGTFTLTGK